MSAATAPQRFMVFAPDCTDPDAHDRRMRTRPVHLERAMKLIDNGFIKVGGPMLTEETALGPADQKRFFGSALICEAKDIDEVRNVIETDIYFQQGVWDKEKLIILPWIATTPM